MKVIPEDAVYRKHVEKIIEYRMGIVNENEDIARIEATLNIGQIAEVIEQAENELELIPEMAKWSPYELKEPGDVAVVQIID